MTLTISYDSSKFIVDYGSSELPGIRELLKQLGGRPLSSTEMAFPPLLMYYNRLRAEVPLYETDSCREFVRDGFKIEFPLVPLPPRWEDLFQHQKDAIEFLLSIRHSGKLLNIFPGGGKTAIASITAKYLGYRNVLIITPLSLLQTWQKEIQKWVGVKAWICYGATPIKNGWVVSNYDTVVRQIQKFKSRWDLIIFDESILLKNRQTKRVAKLRELRTLAGEVWLLSGSPISHWFDDLWSQFNLMMPNCFTSYWRFTDTYCIVSELPWGKTVLGNRQIEPRQEFKDIMFTRTQEESIDLPEMITETIHLDLHPPQKKIYDQIFKQFMFELESGKIENIPSRMVQLVRLQQVVSNPVNLDSTFPDASTKHDSIVEFLDLYEPPFLIWGHFIEGMKRLEARLSALGRSPILVYGGTESDERETSFERFRRDPEGILIINPGVGKFGLTFTNVKTVIYLDKTWNMDDYLQSLHRVKRIGLTHRPVVLSLKCDGTVDDLVERNLSQKATSIQQLTNGQFIDLMKTLRDIRL